MLLKDYIFNSATDAENIQSEKTLLSLYVPIISELPVASPYIIGMKLDLV